MGESAILCAQNSGHNYTLTDQWGFPVQTASQKLNLPEDRGKKKNKIITALLIN